MQSFSRPLNELILEQLPISLVILRATDQVVVYANEKALLYSGYSQSDVGTLSLWDVLVDEDVEHAADEAAKGFNKRATEDGDPSEGFVRFRSKSGLVSTFWFTIKDIVDPDGIVRYRSVLAFIDYDQQASDEHWQEYIHKIVETAVRRAAGACASELNNALAVLRFTLESSGLLDDADGAINQALLPVMSVGEKLRVLGSKQLERSDFELATHDVLSEQQLHQQIGALSATRVLVVDDDELLLEALEDLLQTHGMLVDTATTTQSALACARQRLPDLALIDLRLGDEDGRDTARSLVEEFPSVQILFMTGFANSVQLINREGKYEVLKKPFAIDSLIALLKNKVPT